MNRRTVQFIREDVAPSRPPHRVPRSAQADARRQVAQDAVGFLQQIGTPLTGERTEHERGIMDAAARIAARYGIECPPAPIPAPGSVRCSGPGGCARKPPGGNRSAGSGMTRSARPTTPPTRTPSPSRNPPPP